MEVPGKKKSHHGKKDDGPMAPFSNMFRGFCDPYQPSDVDTVTSTPLDGSSVNNGGNDASRGNDEIPTEIFKTKKKKKVEIQEPPIKEPERPDKIPEGENEDASERAVDEDPPKVEPVGMVKGGGRANKIRRTLEIFVIGLLTVVGTLVVLRQSNISFETIPFLQVKNRADSAQLFDIQPKLMKEPGDVGDASEENVVVGEADEQVAASNSATEQATPAHDADNAADKPETEQQAAEDPQESASAETNDGAEAESNESSESTEEAKPSDAGKENSNDEDDDATADEIVAEILGEANGGEL